MRSINDHPPDAGSGTSRAGSHAVSDAASPLRVLLATAIDYAGLFPPTSLSMSEAVANYAAYRTGPHAWALGRFIIPIARLDEFVAALPAPSTSHSPWPLSALAGPGDPADAIDKADAFNQRHQQAALIDTLEFKTATTSSMVAAARLANKRFAIFLEIPLAGGSYEFLLALARLGTWVKIRTGGQTTEAFPHPAALAQFLEECAAARVPFKATAGLHHPIRGLHPLAGEGTGPTATMHGFLNLLLAAAFARGGWNASQLTDLLGEQSSQAFQFGPDSASWNGHHLPTDALCASRTEFLRSFGSCSFDDPIRDLESLGWLPE